MNYYQNMCKLLSPSESWIKSVNLFGLSIYLIYLLMRRHDINLNDPILIII